MNNLPSTSSGNMAPVKYRRANFSKQEVDILLHEIEKRRFPLCGFDRRGQNLVGSRTTQAALRQSSWRKITERVNTASVESRTISECMRKWRNLIQLVRNYYKNRKNFESVSNKAEEMLLYVKAFKEYSGIPQKQRKVHQKQLDVPTQDTSFEQEVVPPQFVIRTPPPPPLSSPSPIPPPSPENVLNDEDTCPDIKNIPPYIQPMNQEFSYTDDDSSSSVIFLESRVNRGSDENSLQISESRTISPNEFMNSPTIVQNDETPCPSTKASTSKSQQHQPIETRRDEDTSDIKNIIIIDDSSNDSDSVSTQESTPSTSTSNMTMNTMSKEDIDNQKLLDMKKSLLKCEKNRIKVEKKRLKTEKRILEIDSKRLKAAKERLRAEKN
jgi:hypothetical protein